ncbi:MAG: sulfatase-like hydrolase/transferase, partial [Planctomycetales bacterium]|nr:sulfatase-like hydrolase/transferase [Planctomycetales bacterium]
GLKGSIYEGGIRVPLIVRWPGKIKPGRTSERMGAFWDLLPTLCELTGTAAPNDIDGVSFAGELLGRPQPPRDFLYWEFPSYSGQQALRKGDWKAVRTGLMQRGEHKTQLYNLAQDPGETKDVAAEHADVVAELEALMRKSHTRSKLFPFPALDK